MATKSVPAPSVPAPSVPAQSVVQVDAFTSRPFRGNPAAVCVLDAPRDDVWMQAVAAEMNLSETAFLTRESATGDSADFGLRWFTPTVEVDLCGHATLASAHVLWTEGHLPTSAQARFHTRSGLLTADWRNGWIELDFPATPAMEITDGALVAVLAQALGVTPVLVGRSQFDLLVEVATADEVRSLTPDLARLATLDARGVMVTSRGQGEVDFVSRFFGPAAGIPEDPVTGSAHCCLAPFWAERLGKTSFLAHQVSARGGELRVTLAGDRVRLAGQAVTVMRGRLTA